MAKILILGGTRFFGKRLVNRLLANGDEISILTRGNHQDSFGDAVHRLLVDRKDSAALKAAAGNQDWDVVYDNICYTPEEAAQAADIFTGRVGQYVLTSTLSVYDFADHPLREEEFDPYRYPVMMNDKQEYSYKEGKRQAEAVLFGRHNLNVAAVRFPIVLGPDDYTKRLLFHIEHAAAGEPIGLPDPDADISFVHAEEAAEFLQWAGDQRWDGPVNACSSGSITVREIMALIQQEIGRSVPLQNSAAPDHMSPFGIPSNWTLDHAKAADAGFRFWDLKQWMPALITELAADVKLN
ncbi:SDR family oxidoreductase [Paenibacillus sp. JCM 10914]|uniref:NAD-dependent epimerase/dehydratase family protein n=1 Tax=Paenibacillus sp. JCM 10914 TaxID=1236974 RepID=UPI0003CC81CF|nr:NAD-dependent epimerase/dehydratase family protein [Paenibacillus sp. JCM 10914]GAE04581.1 isoflavone_redu, Isoflavone reductase [Paenibacillus sp. JCM 10914]